MHHRRSHRTVVPTLGVVLGLLAVACGPAPATTPGPTTPTSASAHPSSAPASASAPPSASEESSATAGAPTSASPSGFPTAFTVAPNDDADALFDEPDSCRNPQDGYVLAYPDPWYTNTEIRDVPACSWFSPSSYEVDDFATRPGEIAIEIFWVAGGYSEDGGHLSSERGIASGQYAVRAEVEGTPDDASSGTSYFYVVQLGRTFQEGPNLVARTDTSMGGDYDLNKAILDRIIATLEFLGATQ